MPRTGSPSLAIHNIPPDLLRAFLERARREGWHSKNALLIELMREYADGQITPTAAPPAFDPSRPRPGRDE